LVKNPNFGPSKKKLVTNPNIQKPKYFLKIQIYAKIKILVDIFQNSKYCSKIQILYKNPNIVQKSKYCSKIQILFKNPNLRQNQNCGRKSKFLSQKRNFGQKSKFWSKIQILVEIKNVLTMAPKY